MKVYLTFKTPDALNDAAREAAVRAREQGEENQLSHDEIEEGADAAFNEVMEVGEKFIKYGETITVELDTTAKTCTVVK